MAETYSITIQDSKQGSPQLIHVDAPGVFDQISGLVVIDPTVEDTLLAFVNSLTRTDRPAVIVWESAQPGFRSKPHADL